MTIATKTVISFKLPEEYALSQRFKDQHPDWVESFVSSFIIFKKIDTYSVNVKEEQ